MSDLTGRTQNDTFRDLIHFENSNLGFDATLRVIESGNGIGSTLSLSTIGAAIAGTLSVAGVASFDLVPLVSGSPVWYPGNDGAGSGLDADLLDGLQATAFAQAGSPLTITGLWQFQTGPLFTALNDTELARFIDTTNDIQMQVKFDTNLDFSLVPGTSSIFDETKRLYFDSTEEIWSAVDGFNLTGAAAVLGIGASSTIAATGAGMILTAPSAGDIILDADGLISLDSVTSSVDLSSAGAMSLTSSSILALQSSTLMTLESTADSIDLTAELDLLLNSTNGEMVLTGGDSMSFDALSGFDFFSSVGGMDIDVDDFISIVSNNAFGGISLFSAASIFIETEEDIDLNTGGLGDINIDGLAVVLYFDGAPVFTSQDETLATTTSGAQVADGSSSFLDIGFNQMPTDNQAGAFTIGVTNAGHKERYTGAGSQAVTLTDEANIPDGSTWVIVNAGTGALDITITTLTLYDGSGTIVTGNRILAIAGVATITKRIDGQYEIWGAGLT